MKKIAFALFVFIVSCFVSMGCVAETAQDSESVGQSEEAVDAYVSCPYMFSDYMFQYSTNNCDGSFVCTYRKQLGGQIMNLTMRYNYTYCCATAYCPDTLCGQHVATRQYTCH